MKKYHSECGFSLVEVTLALGIAAFTMIAIFGLLPTGMNALHNATEQSVAASAAAAIVADLRETAWTAPSTTAYGIPPNAGGTIRLEEGGGLAAPSSEGRYRATIRIADRNPDQLPDNTADMNPTSDKPTRMGVVTISWPANAAVANAHGKYEMVFALPRSN